MIYLAIGHKNYNDLTQQIVLLKETKQYINNS